MAAHGERIELLPGEYLGPLVIANKPVHLVGRGEQTVIWNHINPVMVITVPGVVLENIAFDVTLRDTLPCIVAEPNCQPQLIRVMPQGAENSFMNIERIDLGTLVANVKTALPFEVQVSGNEKLQLEPLANAVFSPLPNNGRTRRGFLLNVTPPDSEGYLVEMLKWSSNSAQAQREYLIYGQVVMRTDAPAEIALVSADGARTIYFDGQLELGRPQLRLIGGRSSNPPEGRIYGLLMQEGTSHYVLWVPKEPTGKVFYREQQLKAWSRRIIEKDAQIQCDAIAFKAIERSKHPLALSDTTLTFPTITSCTAIRRQITVTFTEQRLLGIGKAEWEGKVESFVPWVQPVTSTLQLDSRANKTCTLEFELQPKAFELEDDRYHFPSALAIYNDNLVYFIGLTLEVRIPAHQFEVLTPQIAFGDAEPLYAGEVIMPGTLPTGDQLRREGRQTHIAIRNTGRQPATFHIGKRVAWLDVAVTSNFQLKPGQETLIDVRLNAQANNLPDGITVQGDALVVECIEASDKPAFIRASLNLAPARRPAITIIRKPQKTAYTFDLNSPPSTLADTFVIANKGRVTGNFIIAADQGVHAEPGSASLASGEERSVTLTFPVRTLRGLSSGDHFVATVRVLSNRATPDTPPDLIDEFVFTVDVVDNYPILHLSQDVITIDNAIEGQPPEFSQTIVVENIGTGVFAGNFMGDGSPWVQVSGEQGNPTFSLASGQSTQFRLSLTHAAGNLQTGLHEATFELKSSTQPLRTPARLKVRLAVEKATAYPKLLSPILWFGVVEPENPTSYAEETLIFANYGHAAWVGTISKAEWLSYPPNLQSWDIVVPASQVLRLPLKVNRGVAKLSRGENVIDRAVVLRGQDGDEYPVSAYILLPKPKAFPEIVEDVIDFGEAIIGQQGVTFKGVLTLRNSGTDTWRIKTVECPDWLQSLKPFPTEIPAGTNAWPIHLQVKPDTVKGSKQSYRGQIRIVGEDDKVLSTTAVFAVVPLGITVAPNELTIRSRRTRRIVSSVGVPTFTITNNNGVQITIPYSVSRNQEGIYVRPELDISPSVRGGISLEPRQSITLGVSLVEDFIGDSFIYIKFGDESHEIVVKCSL